MGFLSSLGSIGGALLGGPIGGSIGGLVGGFLDGQQESSSIQNASNTQQAATNAAVAEQRRQYDLTRTDYAPYREAGTKALGQLQTEMGAPTTAADVMSDPGYQFGLSQGQLALERKAAAAGGRVSGAALKSASEYGTNYATTGYNAAYQRRQDRLNRLAALAGVGQSATNGSASSGATASEAISKALSSQGDATAAGQLAQGNIWTRNGNQLAAIGQQWAGSQAPTSNASFGSNLDGFFKGTSGSGD